jgi:hypothetical protein
MFWILWYVTNESKLASGKKNVTTFLCLQRFREIDVVACFALLYAAIVSTDE